MNRGKRIAPAMAIMAVTAIMAVCGGGLASAASAKPIALGARLRALVHMPGGPPGAIALVQRGRHLTVYRAGVSNVRSRAPMRPNQYMRLASVAKAYSGALALALVTQRRLTLTSTIGQVLPSLPPAWGQVTLRQTLAHTSGLPEFSDDPTFVAYLATHLHARPAPSFMLRFITSRELLFEPGAEYHYANTDNFVAAMMAQATTALPYNRLLGRYVYRPLRLRRTALPRGPAMPRPYVHGYTVRPGKPPVDDSTILSAAYAWASGGLVATPADMNRFIRAYAGARLFSPATRAAQLRFVTGQSDPPGPGANAAGLAIFRYRTRCGTVYGHTGGTPGYTQFMAASRDGSRSVTVSINDQLSPASMGQMLTAFRRLRSIEGDAVCLALRR